MNLRNTLIPCVVAFGVIALAAMNAQADDLRNIKHGEPMPAFRLAAIDGKAALTIGNAVGSNVANIALVLGITALVSPIPVTRAILKIEYVAALIASGVTVVLAWDGNLDRSDGTILLSLFAAFFVLYVFRAMAMRGTHRGEETVGTIAGRRTVKPGTCWALTLLGVVVLIGGARFVVFGASTIASNMGWSEATIGATVVAFGTSLPEVAASLVAALKREHELALGNVLGSNLFNMLFVLGPAAVYPGLDIGGDIMIRSHMVIMMAVTLLLFPMMLCWPKIGRKSGLVLCLFYCAFLFLNLGVAMEWFAVPDFLIF